MITQATTTKTYLIDGALYAIESPARITTHFHKGKPTEISVYWFHAGYFQLGNFKFVVFQHKIAKDNLKLYVKASDLLLVSKATP